MEGRCARGGRRRAHDAVRTTHPRTRHAAPRGLARTPAHPRSRRTTCVVARRAAGQDRGRPPRARRPFRRIGVSRRQRGLGPARGFLRHVELGTRTHARRRRSQKGKSVRHVRHPRYGRSKRIGRVVDRYARTTRVARAEQSTRTASDEHVGARARSPIGCWSSSPAGSFARRRSLLRTLARLDDARR